MTNKKHNKYNALRLGTSRLARLHFLLVFIYASQLIAIDAGRLITPVEILKRWIMVSILLMASAVTWLFSRSQTAKPSTDRALVWFLILCDIIFASFNVYVQRGMASKGVMLYVIPLLLASALKSKSAYITTSLLCVASYISTTVAYFVLNFNEGYKIELYSEIAFYSVLMIIIVHMLWAIVKPSSS